VVTQGLTQGVAREVEISGVRSGSTTYRFNAGQMIVYDDISMPLGRLRFAEKGSAGGHHGIESTLRELSGNCSFPRLKVAVGPDVKSGDLRAAFLLSPIEADLRELYLRSVSVAAEACQLWLTKPIAACMGRYNGLDLTRTSAS
jgi:PTH1 family peptidyl-tRNA hydrolase